MKWKIKTGYSLLEISSNYIKLRWLVNQGLAQIGYLESTGKFVSPNSIYEAQLALRLGRVPAWLEKLK